MRERETFASRLGFILVAAGCAVGIGNVWKFPYICGQYGGAAFIVMYLIFLILLGFPILVSEFAVGRGSGYGMGRAFEKLEPKGTKWHKLKWISIIGSFLLMSFYTMVGGWMLYYAYLEATGKLSGLSVDEVGAAFSAMLNQPVTMGIWAFIAIVLSFCVCGLGLKNGVEKITKVMMSLLVILMIVLAIHSATLPNAGEGFKFYLVPDFNNVKKQGFGTAVFAAMSHAFFTLSLGIGAMEIFGSYLTKEKRLGGEAISVMVLDTFVALMAGFIIIPACFAFGVQPDSGPSLLFITLPNLFNQMAFMDMNDWSRKKSVGVNFIIITLISIPAILGYNMLSKIQLLGSGSTIMDLEDFIVSYNLLPLGSLLFVMFCVRKNGWGFENFLKEANAGEGVMFPKWARVYMQYILPVIVTIVYLKGYYDFFAVQPTGTRIAWMAFAVLLLLVIFGVSIFTGRKKAKN